MADGDTETNSSPLFPLGADNGQEYRAWLSEQLGGYTGWYNAEGSRFNAAGIVIQVSAGVSGLLATIFAAAPKDIDLGFLHAEGIKWLTAIFAAVATALTGVLPTILRLARDREEGRIELTRLRQELDLLNNNPSLGTYLAAKAVVDRIAAVERSYGGSKPSA